MSEQKGYYSLIQFFPDPSRLEVVNIGVALYSVAEKRLHVRISQSNQRIRRFFGNQNWPLVSRGKTAIVNQLRLQHFPSIDVLKEFISKRANSIQLTMPRPMRIVDVQTELDRLFERLVGEDFVERKQRVAGNLSKRLIDAGVADLVKRSVSVQIPNLKKSIRVPYAYQNGRFNLISPVQFEPGTDAILKKTGKSAIEGQLLYHERHADFGQMRLVVVADFNHEIERSTQQLVRRIFDEHHVTLYSFENLDPLVDDIRRSAADHSI